MPLIVGLPIGLLTEIERTNTPPATTELVATRLKVGALSGFTVSEAVLVLVLLPSDVTRLPGETVTGKVPAVGLFACTVIVQLPIAGIEPAMPRLIVAADIAADALHPSTRPDMVKPGTLTEPPIEMTAGEALGLVSVSVSVEFTPALTLPGAKATVMVGTGSGVTTSVAMLVLELLPSDVIRLPGNTVTGKDPALALCA